MQIFANGRWHFHSFIEFLVIIVALKSSNFKNCNEVQDQSALYTAHVAQKILPWISVSNPVCLPMRSIKQGLAIQSKMSTKVYGMRINDMTIFQRATEQLYGVEITSPSSVLSAPPNICLR